MRVFLGLSPMSIRVVIVEDHPLMRDQLRNLCTEHAGFAVVGEAADYTTAVAVLLAQRPDLALLDLELAYEHGPRRSGFDIAEFLRSRLPVVRYVFFSAYCSPEVVRRVAAAGAQGFLGKTEYSLAETVQALHELAEGRPHFSARYWQVREACRLDDADCEKLLTKKEKEVLALVGHALSDAQIADRLGCSVRTVEGHYLHLRHKLGLETRERVMKFAIDRGLTQFEAMDAAGLPAAPCLA
jgi:two-component system, NarL family, nitrate/nitrite response regulator NarL